MRISPRDQSDLEPPRLNPGDGVTSRLLAHATAGPFRVTHKAYSPGFAQGWHEHPAALIDLVLAGSGRGTYHRSDFPSAAGALEYFRHEVRHDFRAGPIGIRSMHVSFAPELLAEHRVDRAMIVAGVESADAVRAALCLLEELHRTRDGSSTLQLESLAHELLGHVSRHERAERTPPGFLRVAREALHASAAGDGSCAVSLAGLAGECGVHPSHLAREFKAHFGVTAGAYHRRLRALRAARRLVGSGESIARVSHATGFADQAHLTRTLRRELGQTPAAMRRLLARGA